MVHRPGLHASQYPGTCAIGRITPSGAVTEFSTGLQAGNKSTPEDIVLGRDGNLWFTDIGGPKHAIGRITPSGTITESSAGLPVGNAPAGIVTGPDGNLWFTDEGTRAIGQLAMRPPAVTTGSATGVSSSGASVAGTVNPLGGAVSPISVQYGPTTAYGSSVASAPASLPPGGTPVGVSATIGGLPPETVIHYRVVATNGIGTSVGLDQTFTTATVTPSVSSARQSHSTWREKNRHSTSNENKKKKKKKKKLPIGTTFSFTLNEQATVRFAVTQMVSGRKVSGRCVATTMKNRTKATCKRLMSRGTLSFTGQRGTNKVPFRGRIFALKLRPGRYTLVIVASVSGRPSAPVRLSFTIVKA